MMLRFHWRLLGWVSLSILVTSCREDTFDEVARICVIGTETSGEFAYEADDPVEVRIRFLECKSGCERVEAAECSASVDGNIVEITGSLTLRTTHGCDHLCGAVYASCEPLQLPEGEYVFRAGEAEVVVPIPSQSPIPYCDPAEDR